MRIGKRPACNLIKHLPFVCVIIEAETPNWGRFCCWVGVYALAVIRRTVHGNPYFPIPAGYRRSDIGMPAPCHPGIAVCVVFDCQIARRHGGKRCPCIVCRVYQFPCNSTRPARDVKLKRHKPCRRAAKPERVAVGASLFMAQKAAVGSERQ